jgi:hypothetical protein
LLASRGIAVSEEELVKNCTPLYLCVTSPSIIILSFTSVELENAISPPLLNTIVFSIFPKYSAIVLLLTFNTKAYGF